MIFFITKRKLQQINFQATPNPGNLTAVLNDTKPAEIVTSRLSWGFKTSRSVLGNYFVDTLVQSTYLIGKKFN